MRRLTLAAVTLAAILAVSLPAAAAVSNSTCAAILVASAEETPKGTFGTQFSATRSTDLTLTVAIQKPFTGEHLVELRLFTPKGFLYRSISVPAAIGTSGSGTRAVHGYPRPVNLARSSSFKYNGAAMWRVDVPFPLGGTDIGRNSLYGTWKAQAYLDGSPGPCGPAVGFKVGP